MNKIKQIILTFYDRVKSSNKLITRLCTTKKPKITRESPPLPITAMSTHVNDANASSARVRRRVEERAEESVFVESSPSDGSRAETRDCTSRVLIKSRRKI